MIELDVEPGTEVEIEVEGVKVLVRASASVKKPRRFIGRKRDRDEDPPGVW